MAQIFMMRCGKVDLNLYNFKIILYNDKRYRRTFCLTGIIYQIKSKIKCFKEKNKHGIT